MRKGIRESVPRTKKESNTNNMYKTSWYNGLDMFDIKIIFLHIIFIWRNIMSLIL